MLSAIILTKNSALTLNRTLSFLLWVEDIIIIDDYSTDETRAIAKKYKARVFKRHLCDDFSEQRNFGLEKPIGEWVLFIDSDEVVSPELKKEILKEILNHKSQFPNKINGYFMKRKDFFLGRELRHGETAHVKLLRLARRNAGKWVRPVHETWDIKGETGILASPLLHYSHDNVVQFITEINHYSTTNASYLHSMHVRPTLFHIVAYPVGKFFQNYFLKLGFLDGTAGFVVAAMMSFHSFLTRAKLYIFNNKK